MPDVIQAISIIPSQIGCRKKFRKFMFMKIFSAAQIRQWDAYTIANEPISSVDLMERAASACCRWITDHFSGKNIYTIFCGTGNNGGDGLAIARMLLQAGNNISVHILESQHQSEDFKINLQRLQSLVSQLHLITEDNLLSIQKDAIIIDALFGTGLNRPPEHLAARLISCINQTNNIIISVDIPSGLFADTGSGSNAIIRATHTLSFQVSKPAFFLEENLLFTGDIHLLDIGLHAQFYKETPTDYNTIDPKKIESIFKPRNRFSHKYNFGHALLYAGSKDMMGAAILSAKACLRSGAGLVTVYTADATQAVIQSSFPEAITSTEKDFEILSLKKSAIGFGPGIGLSEENTTLLSTIISSYAGQLVIDATGLQIVAALTHLLQQRNSNPAILTPHKGEFERLFGKTANDFECINLATEKAAELNCYIILKGHHTLIVCPDGRKFFNTTGNAGMATAGSGDVLTGMLTGLLAQGYAAKDACLLAVYLHGTAGDIAAEKMSQEAMLAGDIIDCIGDAYKKIAPPFKMEQRKN